VEPSRFFFSIKKFSSAAHNIDGSAFFLDFIEYTLTGFNTSARGLCRNPWMMLDAFNLCLRT
jgi:hypothetical protein